MKCRVMVRFHVSHRFRANFMDPEMVRFRARFQC